MPSSESNLSKLANPNRTTLVCLFLILTTLAVFWQVREHDFIDFDDSEYVTENFHVQAGLTRDGFVWAFTTTHLANWHPLTWLSHMLDYQLFGLKPGGHHLTNVWLHILNTLLLFLLLKQMTGALWRSACVAFLFGLHPLHVESVAWVSGRKDVLSTLFWLLTTLAYVRYVKRPGLKNYLLIFVSFALGLMAKPMLVTLPCVLLLLDYWPLGRFQIGPLDRGLEARTQASVGPWEPVCQTRRLFWEKAPLFALTAVSSVMTFLAQQKGGAVMPLDRLEMPIRLANAVTSYVRYMVKMIWPQGLVILYPHPGNSLPMWQAVGAGLLLASISIAVIGRARRYPYLAVGWLWYLGTLVPVIGLVQVGGHAMADRYTYVPLIGLFIIIAWGIPELAQKMPHRRVVLGTAASMLLVCLMLSTWLQVSHWKNNISLFTHALNETVNNNLIHNNLGVALERQGKLQEAAAHYSEALRIKPDYVDAHNNVGAILAGQGRIREAMEHYSEVLRINPDDVKVHYNLGVALEGQGKLQEAGDHYSEALRINPHYMDAHNNLGNVLERQGKFKDALFHFSRALELKPRSAEVHYNMGNVLARQGDMEAAIVHLSRAVQLKPDFAEAHNNLGTVLFFQRTYKEAIDHFTRALQLNPDYSEARRNLKIARERVESTER